MARALRLAEGGQRRVGRRGFDSPLVRQALGEELEVALERALALLARGDLALEPVDLGRVQRLDWLGLVLG